MEIRADKLSASTPLANADHQIPTRDCTRHGTTSLSLTHILSLCSQESWNSIRALGGDPDSSGIEALGVRKVRNATKNELWS
jgi:hypothetical protein